MKKLTAYLLLIIAIVGCNTSESNCAALQTENAILHRNLDTATLRNTELTQEILALKQPKYKVKKRNPVAVNQQLSTPIPVSGKTTIKTILVVIVMEDSVLPLQKKGPDARDRPNMEIAVGNIIDNCKML